MEDNFDTNSYLNMELLRFTTAGSEAKEFHIEVGIGIEVIFHRMLKSY